MVGFDWAEEMTGTAPRKRTKKDHADFERIFAIYLCTLG
jgi:hypothetical protein